MDIQNYYSRSEAAIILKVSVASIARYLQKGYLTSINHSNRILIPCEEVHNFYNNNNTTSSVTLQQHQELKMEMNRIQSDIEVLKSALGVGKRFAYLSDNDLKSIYRKIMEQLKLSEWDVRTIFEVCDIAMSLKEQDIGRLILLQGTSTWNCMIDLLDRMLFYTSSVTFTENAQDIIKTRIQAVKNRLYGMIFVQQSKIDTDESYWARSLGEKESTDIYVLSFLENRKYYSSNSD